MTTIYLMVTYAAFIGSYVSVWRHDLVSFAVCFAVAVLAFRALTQLKTNEPAVTEKILEKLGAVPSGMKASELAEACGTSHASIYIYLDRLKRAGKVTLWGRRWYLREA